MNTTDYLLQKGENQAIALITGKNHYSYRDLHDATACLAQELLAAGIQPADRVGLIGANSLFWVAAYLAILKIGAVAVPFPVTLTPAELQTRQNFVRCKAICLEKRYYQRLLGGLSTDAHLIFEDSLKNSGTVSWAAIPTSGDEPEDAVYLFTSGTTARPRVVRLTHRNIQANTDSIVEYLELTPADRIMAILPFHYCFGTSLLHTHLRVGGSVVLSRFLYPETVLDTMEATECTGIAGVPSIYQTLLRNTTFPKRELKSLRKVQQAGGKLQTVLIKELVAAVPQAKVYIMYGQTEATARLSYLLPELLATKLGSVGQGIPGVTLEVRGESGAKVQPGEVGEIVARGDNISPGYLDEPEATAKKFRDGALYTGDLATVDEDDFIYVVDRKDDFIKSYGHRVSSQDIESGILELPEIVAAAAVGLPDLVRGEAIRVYVTLRAGSQLTPEQIIAHCKQRMAHHMVPQEVVILPSLPLNENGKVLKSVLRRQAIEELEAKDKGAEVCAASPELSI